MFGVFLLILMVAFILVPFRIAAKFLGVRRYSYKICFFAVISSGVAEAVAIDMVSNVFLASIIALILTGIFFSVLFDAEFKQGIIISLLALVIQFCSILILGGLGLGIYALSV